MYIDIAVGGTIVLLALLGLITGFWGQFLRLIALGSLYFLAPPFAEWRHIESRVSEALGPAAPEASVQGVSLIVAAVSLYIIMAILIAIMMMIIMRGKTKSPTNRILGFVLGGVKGAALCYLLLCGLVLFVQAEETYTDNIQLSGDLRKALSDIEEQAGDSAFFDLVYENNILEELGYDLDALIGELVPLEETAVPPNQQIPVPTQPGLAQPAQPGPVVTPTQPGMLPTPGVAPTQPGIGPGTFVTPSPGTTPGLPPDK